jgi:hypothetical protein
MMLFVVNCDSRAKFSRGGVNMSCVILVTCIAQVMLGKKHWGDGVRFEGYSVANALRNTTLWELLENAGEFGIGVGNWRTEGSSTPPGCNKSADIVWLRDWKEPLRFLGISMNVTQMLAGAWVACGSEGTFSANFVVSQINFDSPLHCLRVYWKWKFSRMTNGSSRCHMYKIARCSARVQVRVQIRDCQQ